MKQASTKRAMLLGAIVGSLVGVFFGLVTVEPVMNGDCRIIEILTIPAIFIGGCACFGFCVAFGPAPTLENFGEVYPAFFVIGVGVQCCLIGIGCAALWTKLRQRARTP
jgi:hypothetical protein